MSASLDPAEMLRRGFDGAVMLVVGGSGDIGSATVAQAAALGATVIAASRRLPTSDVSHLDPKNIETLELDITSTASIESALAEVERRHGRLDVLVNTAGSTRSVPLGDLDALSDEIIDEVFASNITGPLRLIREARRLLEAGTAPVVVQVSSVAARTGLGSNIAYGASKAALDASIIALAKALAPQIRLVNISPSALANDFVPGRGVEFLERTIAQTPLNRLATADEVATSILAAARLLTATTGVTIAVDGGRHL